MVNVARGSCSLMYLCVCFTSPHCSADWTVDINDFTQCYLPHGVPQENVTNCVIHFTFCRALEKPCANLVEDGYAICEAVTLNDGTVASYNLGFYTTEHDFHPKGKT